MKCVLRQRGDTIYVTAGDQLLSLSRWARATPGVTVTIKLNKEERGYSLVAGEPRRRNNLTMPREYDPSAILVHVSKVEEGGVITTNLEWYEPRFLGIKVRCPFLFNDDRVDIYCTANYLSTRLPLIKAAILSAFPSLWWQRIRLLLPKIPNSDVTSHIAHLAILLFLAPPG